MFLTREAGSICASLVTGAPLAIFLHVDEAYDNFLAQCEVNKRPLRPTEDSMKIGASEYMGETPPAGVKRMVVEGHEDLGMVTDKFGTKPKVKFKFQLEDRDTKGRRFRVVRTYNAVWGSSQKQSSLREDMAGLRGRPFTDQEIKAVVDLDQFTGMNGMVFLVHKPSSDGRVFANVKSLMPDTGEKPPLTVEKDENGGDYSDRQQAAAVEGLRAQARASETAIDPSEAAL